MSCNAAIIALRVVAVLGVLGFMTSTLSVCRIVFLGEDQDNVIRVHSYLPCSDTYIKGD